MRVRVKTLQEVADASTYFFKDVTEYDEKGVAKHFKPENISIMEQPPLRNSVARVIYPRLLLTI